ncbi:GMC family oxidoreductase [Nonomuraea jabiensis]|uniref:GMC family oxidoreductase n=1 Tax=Nonomuraea jabiensis TaxID=882448 RepID=UPI00369A7761
MRHNGSDQARRPAREHADVVVVGSGFGGAVAAYRFAEAGLRVVLLERGRPYPPGSFPRAPAAMARNLWDPSEGLYGLFDLWSFGGLGAAVSSGLGGGSLVYANVLLRKPERWFVKESPLPGGGYEHWPVTRADLDPHYDAVERMLKPQRYPLGQPPYDTTAKTLAMREAAGRLGLEWELPPLAVAFAPEPGGHPAPGLPIPDPEYGNLHGLPRTTCRLRGECDLGCNDGAKNSLDHTYLSAARHAGADLRTLHEVRWLAPAPGGGYAVSYVRHEPGEDRRRANTRRLPQHTITCDRLVLAAGTLGTTYLLLTCRSEFPGLSPMLGARFSGNGDLLTLVMDARDGAGRHRSLEGSRGPVITSAIRVPDAADSGRGDRRGFLIQDAGYPPFAEWLGEFAGVRGQVRRAGRFVLHRIGALLSHSPRTRINAELAALLGDGHLSDGSLGLLGMGRDIPDGVMRLRRGYLDVDWTTSTSMPYFTTMRAAMRDMARVLRGGYHDNPLWLARKVITVHPLGGAPMGRHPAEGVVDEYGEVFGHPGLYVLDGACVPGPVGVNPSLTIAALSDRACEHVLESAPRTAARRAGVSSGLSFTEEMRGHVMPGSADPEEGERLGRANGHPLAVHLTITAGDVERFVADAGHEASAAGWVTCPALGGGRLRVEDGSFNLFVAGEDPARRRMLYRLHFTGDGDAPLTLTGFKDVHDDPGADLWSDTSTLYVRILRGHTRPADDAEAEVVAAGIIRIHLQDFLHQLTTFRTWGHDGAAGLVRFGRLFLGELWDAYHDLAAGSRVP